LPDLVVIAGPNGAGKSTAAPFLIGERLGIAEFVNADVIAAGLSAFSPESVAIEAGRIMLRRLDELSEAGADFAFETTLGVAQFCAVDCEVAARTGIPIPSDLSLANYSPIADSWALYDNSSVARLIARREPDRIAEIVDMETLAMIERIREAREERAVRYETAIKREGFAGVPIAEITKSLQAAGQSAWRRHKALGHPIVIWRDGKVVTVPPEEIGP